MLLALLSLWTSLDRVVSAQSDDHVAEFFINAVDSDDNALTDAENRTLKVDAGDTIYLELSYTDLRSRFLAGGLFAFDLYLEISDPNAIELLLTERHRISLSSEVFDVQSGFITFTIEDSDQTETIAFADFSMNLPQSRNCHDDCSDHCGACSRHFVSGFEFGFGSYDFMLSRMMRSDHSMKSLRLLLHFQLCSQSIHFGAINLGRIELVGLIKILGRPMELSQLDPNARPPGI